MGFPPYGRIFLLFQASCAGLKEQSERGRDTHTTPGWVGKSAGWGGSHQYVCLLSDNIHIAANMKKCDYKQKETARSQANGSQVAARAYA
jgi:hypothetical protein